jgi:hypothetical protein
MQRPPARGLAEQRLGASVAQPGPAGVGAAVNGGRHVGRWSAAGRRRIRARGGRGSADRSGAWRRPGRVGARNAAAASPSSRAVVGRRGDDPAGHGGSLVRWQGMRRLRRLPRRPDTKVTATGPTSGNGPRPATIAPSPPEGPIQGDPGSSVIAPEWLESWPELSIRLSAAVTSRLAGWDASVLTVASIDQRATTPGASHAPGAVGRTELPDSAAGLRDDGQPSGAG